MIRNGKLYISLSTDKGWKLREGILLLAIGCLIILGVVYPVVALGIFALCAGLLLLKDIEWAFCFLFFLVPFATVFKYSPVTASLFTYLEIVLVARIVFRNVKSINQRFFVCFFVFVVYVIVGSDLQVTTIIKQLMVPLLIYGFFRDYQSDLKQVLLFFTFGLLLSSVFAQFIDQIPNLGTYIVLDLAHLSSESVLRRSGLYSDPNYYSVALIMAITGLLTLFVNEQMGAFSLVLVVALIMFGAQTVSKSFLLMLAVVLALFVVSLFYRKRYLVSIVFLVVIVLLLIAVLNGEIAIFSNIIERLTLGKGNTESLTTGRTISWKIYSEYIFGDNFFATLFGQGIGAGFPENIDAAHNTYLDMLYYYGFIGSMLFIVTCAYACPKQTGEKQYNVNMLLWGVLLVMIFFLSYLKYYDFAFMIILAIQCYRGYGIKNEQEI